MESKVIQARLLRANSSHFHEIGIIVIPTLQIKKEIHRIRDLPKITELVWELGQAMTRP